MRKGKIWEWSGDDHWVRAHRFLGSDVSIASPRMRARARSRMWHNTNRDARARAWYTRCSPRKTREVNEMCVIRCGSACVRGGLSLSFDVARMQQRWRGGQRRRGLVKETKRGSVKFAWRRGGSYKLGTSWHDTTRQRDYRSHTTDQTTIPPFFHNLVRRQRPSRSIPSLPILSSRCRSLLFFDREFRLVWIFFVEKKDGRSISPLVFFSPRGREVITERIAWNRKQATEFLESFSTNG